MRDMAQASCCEGFSKMGRQPLYCEAMEVKRIRDSVVSDECKGTPGDGVRELRAVRMKSMLRGCFGTVELCHDRALTFAKSYGITALATADSTLSELVESTAVTA